MSAAPTGHGRRDGSRVPGAPPQPGATQGPAGGGPRGGIRVVVGGIGLLGPGLPDWHGGRALLLHGGGWQRVPTQVPPPARLPATERRRAGAVVKASIVVADEAVAMAGADPAQLATVFGSSTGDPDNCHLLCEALAAPQRLVSPTRFTNSVHNAAAGYWHIATRSLQPSTSLSGFDASFAAALLEAAVQCSCSARPVLLVACDVPYPEPLHAVRPVSDTFGVAFVLLPDGSGDGRGSGDRGERGGGAGVRMTLRCRSVADPGTGTGTGAGTGAGGGATSSDSDSGTAPADATRATGAGSAAAPAATPCDDPALDALRRSVPAARALALLQALARGAAATVVLDGPPGLWLQVDVAAAR